MREQSRCGLRRIYSHAATFFSPWLHLLSALRGYRVGALASRDASWRVDAQRDPAAASRMHHLGKRCRLGICAASSFARTLA